MYIEETGAFNSFYETSTASTPTSDKDQLKKKLQISLTFSTQKSQIRASQIAQHNEACNGCARPIQH